MNLPRNDFLVQKVKGVAVRTVSIHAYAVYNNNPGYVVFVPLTFVQYEEDDGDPTLQFIGVQYEEDDGDPTLQFIGVQYDEDDGDPTLQCIGVQYDAGF